MRCFLSSVGALVLSGSGVLAEKVNAELVEQNTLALERAVKMYVAFEARYEIGPGTASDLKLPDKAKFYDATGAEHAWVFPVALGLEIKIGEEQRRIVVISPAQTGDRLLVATDDLTVAGYSQAELKSILDAIAKRRALLEKAPNTAPAD